jgi:surface protein
MSFITDKKKINYKIIIFFVFIILILTSFLFQTLILAFCSQTTPDLQISTFQTAGTQQKIQAAGDFISIWDTTKTSSGSSNSSQVTLPLHLSGTYNFNVNWGDNSSDVITAYNQTEITHTYSSAGIYTITISGLISGWRFNNGGDRLKIIEISQWGTLNFGNSGAYFRGASNLNLTATDSPDLTGTTSFSLAFADCYNLGSFGNMNSWNVSSIVFMNNMFSKAYSFNQPIDAWNVSSVTTMYGMFSNARHLINKLDHGMFLM